MNGEIFTESGLLDIPTAELLQHGIFGAGVYATFQNTSHLPRDVVAYRINFGMFDRVELGLTQLELQGKNYAGYGLAHVKAQLLSESGLIPYIAIGIENLGDKVKEQWNTYHPQSTFFVISKTFNLPRIHLISGHIGLGNKRFAFDDSAVGLFGGVSTGFQPAYARGEITLNLEYDGSGINIGMRHTSETGLLLALGVETLNKPDEIRYHINVSWSNAKMLEKIESANRLARQAARLAAQARRTPIKTESKTE